MARQPKQQRPPIRKMTAEHERRRFQVLEFGSDRDILIIRSKRPNRNSAHIDVIFYGVTYAEIRTFLREGLRFVDANQKEIARVKNIVGRELKKVFALESGDQRFLVGAVSVKVVENQLDEYQNLPLFQLALHRRAEDLGTVIYEDWNPPRGEMPSPERQ